MITVKMSMAEMYGLAKAQGVSEDRAKARVFDALKEKSTYSPLRTFRTKAASIIAPRSVDNTNHDMPLP